MAAAAPAFSQSSALEEVVVTATRQTSTVNRVPLSITAQTQETLDKQGIRNIADLQRTMPGLNVSSARAGVSQLAIRGITSTQGAAVTGVYFDDTNLTKRNNAGSGATGVNGVPTPPLFDMERVEVLRGPQGTLYGGSSQGGTVRFISTTPSLTTFSGNARATLSALPDIGGSQSFDLGAAIGGPIIEDKLGFRFSVFDQHTGGYIDKVDPYNGFVSIANNINTTDAYSFRGALRWAPSDKLEVNLGYFHSYVKEDAFLNTYYLPNGNTFTVPSACYNTTRQFGQSPGPTAAVPCPANAVPGQTVAGIYQRPAQTYGPLDVGKYETIDLIDSAQNTTLDVIPLTLSYDFGWMTAKSITSYIRDRSELLAPGNFAEVSNQQRTTAFPNAGGFLLFRQMPYYAGSSIGSNTRRGLTEELRFSSPEDASRLTWVAGLYLSELEGEGVYCMVRGADQFNQALFGITTTQRFGLPESGCGAARNQTVKDTEIAGFGEVNFDLTEQWKLIAGLRVSRTEFEYYQEFYGYFVGWEVPTLANSGLTTGSVKETPVTPKLGVQYQFTPTEMVYATASTGYRVGGVNTPLTPSLCAPGLAALGLTVADTPEAYDSDTVISYEIGAKMRALDGRLNIRAAVYQIDWEDIQLTVSGFATGCNQTYVDNAGTARSRGAEFETEAQLAPGLVATLGVSYTNAEYTSPGYGPIPASGAAPVILVREGDTFPVPEWTGNVGLQYDFTWGEYLPYVRTDYSYQGSYFRTPPAGSNLYLPDSRDASAVRRLDLRAGVLVGDWDLNLFVNNVLNSDDVLTATGGRSACSVATGAACTTFGTYQPHQSVGITRPREIGAQVLYRF